MNTRLGLVAGAILAPWILGAAGSPAAAAWSWERANQFSAWTASQREELAVAGWPETSRLMAKKMMEKYGEPDAVSALLLTWNGRGPWKRILVYREAGTGELGVRSGDVLQEFVAYEVPVGRWRALTSFGHGVSYDSPKRELSSRSDSEEKNFLALNLADQVVRGKKEAASARRRYEKILALSLSGKSSRYMRKLLFLPETGDAPARP